MPDLDQQLIGRLEERKTLDGIFQSKTAEFVAVYGRRRVGKTFLIKTVFKNKDCIFFHITGTRNADMHEQIADFTRIIETVFYNNELEFKNPANWKKTFELLTQAIKRETSNKKIVLFFDELPWLASKKSRFIQALDYYWNRYWSDLSQIKLIVCGSAASWMIDNVISHKGGLHNRISRQILLSPFDLKESKEYLHSKGIKYTDAQVLETYMVMGGIPYYLNLLKRNLSVTQNIDQLCFRNKGELVDEFNRLYSSLFDNAEIYEELIRIIAAKRSGVERKEILQKSKYSTDGGRLKQRLKALETSGFIVSFTPYGFSKRGTYFRIIDEYSLFYLNWIEPALSNIRKLDKTKGYWLEKSHSPSWHAWSGYAFESVCYKHLSQIRDALNITSIAEVGSWQYIPKKSSKETGAQIDLLFDRTDKVITVCELKYSNDPFALTKDEAAAIQKKIEIFQSRIKTTKQFHIVLITNMPIKDTMYSEEIVTFNVTLVDLML